MYSVAFHQWKGLVTKVYVVKEEQWREINVDILTGTAALVNIAGVKKKKKLACICKFHLKPRVKMRKKEVFSAEVKVLGVKNCLLRTCSRASDHITWSSSVDDMCPV